MPGLSLVALWSIAAFLGLAGLFNLAAPIDLRETIANWNYPADLARRSGIIEILAALCLSSPGMRLVGLGLAGFVFFGAVVTLVERNRYHAAVAGVIMMTALIPAALTLPRGHF